MKNLFKPWNEIRNKTGFWICVFLMVFNLNALILTSGCGTIHAITHSSVFHVDSGTNSPSGGSNPASVGGAVQKEVHLMWWVAALLAITAGIMAYPFQNYFMAIKLGLAALLLPIFATFWSLYWGWVVAAVLVGIAVIAYLHYRVVINPALEKLKDFITKPKT